LAVSRLSQNSAAPGRGRDGRMHFGAQSSTLAAAFAARYGIDEKED
jgi:hypothetical protein